MSTYWVKYTKQRLTRHLKLTQQFLKKHSLLAVSFDKGTGFCVMKSEQYQKKIMDILNLPQFQKLTAKRKNAKDFIFKEEDRVVGALSELLPEGRISEELRAQLCPKGSQPPRLYGLAKVHTAGVPLHPVLSMSDSP